MMDKSDKDNIRNVNNCTVDGYTMLETGRYYRIKDSVKTKVTRRKIKYCGIDKYNAQTS